VTEFNHYLKYDGLSEMPYKIIDHLVHNNEMLWKLLYYDTADAWNKDNLTTKQKSDLIYRGQPDSSVFKVFQTALTNDIWTKQNAIMRIYEAVTTPTTHLNAVLNFEIDVLCNSKIDQLDNYQTRSLRMKQEVLSTLNGTQVNGVGLLEFNLKNSHRDIGMLNLRDDKGWVGYSVVLSAGLG
jgi:hypothetical protein